MLKQIQNQYSGLSHERPANLPIGSLFIDEEKGDIYVYNGAPEPVKSVFLPYSGWASYVDDQYSVGSQFQSLAGVPILLPNNAGVIRESQIPYYIDSYYDAVEGKILGRNGDGLDIMTYWKATPSAVNAELKIWLDIGTPESPIKLYEETKYFRGATEKGVLYSLPSAYTLDTWQANGGKIWIQSSVNTTHYGMTYNFDTSHKAK